MEAFFGKLGEALVTQFGLLGIVVVILCLAIVFMFKRYDDMFKLYISIQDKRVDEVRASVTALERAADALEGLSTLIRDRRRT